MLQSLFSCPLSLSLSLSLSLFIYLSLYIYIYICVYIIMFHCFWRVPVFVFVERDGWWWGGGSCRPRGVQDLS